MTTDTKGIEEKAVDLIEKFEKLATDIAPDAVDLGLAAARVAAAQELLALVVSAALLAVLIPFTFRAIARLRETDETIDFAKSMFGAAGAFIAATATFASLSVWPFVGIFYPEIWIAKQVLGW